MSNISIKNLEPDGFKQFQDLDDFLVDLNDEAETIKGGLSFVFKDDVGAIFAADDDIKLNNVNFNINIGGDKWW